jgi:hypothetical protein
MHLCYRILELVDQDHYKSLSSPQKRDRYAFSDMISSRLTPSFRYNTSHGTIVADRQAVAAGTATEDQANRVRCLFFLFDIYMCYVL